MITKEQSRVFIGSQVCDLLDARGMSRYRLARELGVSDVRIKDLCEGNHEPGFSFVANLAEFFGVPIGHFLESDES